MKPKVLVLGGNEYKMLTVARGLAKEGLEVHAVSPNKKGLVLWSKTINKKFVIDENFLYELKKLNEKEKYALIFPSCEGLRFFEGNKKVFDNMVLSDKKNIKIAADKEKAMRLAKGLNVKIPKTISLKNIKDLDKISKKLKYPVIIKPSHIEEDGYKPEYVFNEESFIEKYKEYHSKSKFPIVQEIIIGQGAGVFVLCDKGKPVQFFGHKRLLEQDPKGAGSAVCVSMEIPKKVKKDAEKMCKKLKWDGVIMFEYKIDKNSGEFFLIEINARFWGSLALALHAGINFPYLLYKMHSGEKIKESNWSETTSSYFLGKMKYLLRVFRGNRRNTDFIFPSKKEGFLKIIKIKGKKDFVWDKKDPLPFFADIISNLRK